MEVTGKPALRLHSEPFGVDIRNLGSGEHVVAVRVDSDPHNGGLWRPVSLVSAEAEWDPTSDLEADQHLAFYTEQAYSDLEAEFELRRDVGHSGVGLIVRAQDTQRYYVVEFPFCAQQIREGHFWAAITQVEGNGWARVLMCERVPGVPAEAGLWNHGRVTVTGDEIRLWVNGRPLPPVRDDTYPRFGRIGLLNWGGCSLRNLRVSGRQATDPAWDGAVRPIRPWFHICPEVEDQQGTPGLSRAANGDLLLVVNTSVLRSKDIGRTWENEVPYFDTPGRNINSYESGACEMQDGRIVAIVWAYDHIRGRNYPNHVVVSHDNGHTWSEPINTGIQAESSTIPCLLSSVSAPVMLGCSCD